MRLVPHKNYPMNILIRLIEFQLKQKLNIKKADCRDKSIFWNPGYIKKIRFCRRDETLFTQIESPSMQFDK